MKQKTLVVLEWITGVVLILVLVALGWMTAVSFLAPSWCLLAREVEILGVLGLLTAALCLVSALALL